MPAVCALLVRSEFLLAANSSCSSGHTGARRDRLEENAWCCRRRRRPPPCRPTGGRHPARKRVQIVGRAAHHRGPYPASLCGLAAVVDQRGVRRQAERSRQGICPGLGGTGGTRRPCRHRRAPPAPGADYGRRWWERLPSTAAPSGSCTFPGSAPNYTRPIVEGTRPGRTGHPGPRATTATPRCPAAWATSPWPATARRMVPSWTTSTPWSRATRSTCRPRTDITSTSSATTRS